MQDDGRSGKKPIEEVEAVRPNSAKVVPLRHETTRLKEGERRAGVLRADKEEALRQMGLDLLGDVPWGTHFCVFYHSKQDLIDILVPYFRAGLENNEFCMWITSEPLSAEDAEKSLSQAVTNLDDYIKKGQIEILDYSDWYTKTGVFEADRVLKGWVQKHDEAIKRGFYGLRLTGNTFWLEKKDWSKFVDYEAVVNSVIGKYKMLAICTYSLDKCGASEILDVEHNHQFSLIKWRGDWKILESSSRNQLEARLAEQTAITQALERSKKDWVKTFNAMSDWVILIDLKSRIIRTNRAGENFTGKTLDEIIGQSCCKLVHGQDKQIPGCPLRIMLHTRQRAATELNVPNTNHWLMVTVDPVVDGKGNLIGAVHITRDITQRKKDEKALRDSEERYKYLFEQSPLGIGLATPDGRLVHINKAMEVITGYFREELKKINLADIYENPQDQKKLLETIERYGCVVDFPTRLKRKDGTVYDVLLNVSRVHLGGRELFQTICMDITERKRAEDALRESEERLSVVFEKVPAVLLLVDRDRRVHLANEAAIRFAKRTADEMIDLRGGNALRCLHSLDDPKGCGYGPFCEICVVRNTVLETFKTSKNLHQREARLPFDIDGQTRELSLLVSTATLKVSGQQMVLVCLEDITERKKAEESLAKSEENYRSIFETANDAVFIHDVKDGTILDVNKKMLKMYGFDDKSDIVGSFVGNLSSGEKPYTVEDAGKWVRRAVKEGPQLFEWYAKDKKGRLFWVEVNLKKAVIGGEDRILAIVRDISERKKTEEQVEKLAKFPAENQSPVLRISARGTVIYGNEASLPLLKFWQCRINGSVSGCWYDFVLDALSSGQSQQTEVQCDGQTFSLSFAPVMDANYVNVYGLDITERKQAEEEVRMSHDYLERLTNSMWDTVFSVKIPERVIEWVNNSVRLIGYEPRECVGKNTEFLYPDKSEFIDFGNKLQKAINAGEDVLHAEQLLRRKNGETFSAEITTTFFREKGQLCRITSIVRDITERKDAEKRLLDYQEQLKSLASQMTLTEEQERRRIATDLHDNITQSLAMSKLKLDLVRDSNSSSSADFDEVLNETSKNIEQIIQGVRTLTFDLSSPILYELGFEAAVAEWLTERIEKEHYIATEFEDDEQPKPLDDDTRTVLFRDVRELLTNVVKHAQAKKVKVSIRKVGSRIHVIVEDDGRGFDPEKVAATAAKKGVFGLFSIRERLKQLGGNIEIESASGHGTRVTLTAPLKSES